jgi:hypothetical protein
VVSPTPEVQKRGWPHLLSRVVFGLTVAALLVGGVIAVGNAARDSLIPTERHLIRFVEIDCPIPAGMTRETFLGEVQYNEQLPDRINLLDRKLPDQLRVAFTKHPRVSAVGEIAIGPGKKVRVELSVP